MRLRSMTVPDEMNPAVKTKDNTNKRKKKAKRNISNETLDNKNEVVHSCNKPTRVDRSSPEVIIAEDISHLKNKRKGFIGNEPQASSSTTTGSKQEIICITPEISSRKRKSLNDSIVILRELNREDGGTLPSKKRRRKESTDVTVMNAENSNDSVVSLCSDDDDVTIVSVPSTSTTSPKKTIKPAEDIILLDPSPKCAEASSASSFSFKGKKRNKTCTVTSSNNATSLLNYAPTNGSMLSMFSTLPVSSTFAAAARGGNGAASSSTSLSEPLFTFDTRGYDPYRSPRRRNWTTKQNLSSRGMKKYRHQRHNLPVAGMNSVPTRQNSLAPGTNVFGSNIYNPNSQPSDKPAGGLRPVIIDGSNVAIGHSNGTRIFSCRGLQICVNYFVKRGHAVKAFVPNFRKGCSMVSDRHILDELEKAGQVVFTPSRRVEGRLVVPYDDRYIVQCAAELGGIIVTNDNYRDLLNENEAWRETIQDRLLMFTWVGDLLMFPSDPLGRHGPQLEEFLRFPQ